MNYSITNLGKRYIVQNINDNLKKVSNLINRNNNNVNYSLAYYSHSSGRTDNRVLQPANNQQPANQKATQVSNEQVKERKFGVHPGLAQMNSDKLDIPILQYIKQHPEMRFDSMNESYTSMEFVPPSCMNNYQPKDAIKDISLID
ncbi:hypothetical protein DFA_06270 [Cavenderia fasciculata]|uniref:Uncharacterized protein n=1 Tax=Cavenderia fasciculata TaxID=261658 RepID=F4PKK5_CACFS|nr:uncharacterized protein DFA_06270 [Cavenderia fasciculata]EGG24129.1 hypothetical protein DFA_06270 [Cavenderia fasciculata]|eukprot:XP_004361980.1 hypothetical protein DFA_06270 [Cavenderia fasciculata]